jgi:hypothetical protein
MQTFMLIIDLIVALLMVAGVATPTGLGMPMLAVAALTLSNVMALFVTGVL